MYSLSHVAGDVVRRNFVTIVSTDCSNGAMLLAHLGEIDERKLYLPVAYSSTFSYCVREMKMSDGTALKRIRLARLARRFPAIFPALADKRLHPTAVIMLARHLKPENADELLAAAANKTETEIRTLLAERFPRRDVPTAIQPVEPAAGELSVRTVGAPDPELSVRTVEAPNLELSARTVGAPNLELSAPTEGTQLSVRTVVSTNLRGGVEPLSPGRFALQVTVDQQTRDQLRYAQSLLGHAVPSKDVAQVLKRALDALVRELEKKKFAKGVSTRPRRGAKSARYVPAEIRRTVWHRDVGQCTFVSTSGKRCEERGDLEFDHIEPLARGGRTMASNLRLRCRGHNQYEAERAFGADFMRGKREEARRRTEQARANTRAKADDAKAHANAAEAKALAQADAKALAEATARAAAEAAARAAAEDAARAAAEAAAAQAAAAAEVIPFLLHLGFNAKDARQGAAHAARLADAPLDQRVRVALQNLAPPCRRIPAPGISAAT